MPQNLDAVALSYVRWNRSKWHITADGTYTLCKISIAACAEITDEWPETFSICFNCLDSSKRDRTQKHVKLSERKLQKEHNRLAAWNETAKSWKAIEEARNEI